MACPKPDMVRTKNKSKRRMNYMGCFSCTFADYGNMRNLTCGESGYLYCPDGTVLHEPSYDGYGKFAGQDMYDLVADWNRKFLSEHPEFEILGGYQEKKYPVSKAEWYPAYADLSKSREEVVASAPSLYDWRCIGIAIACYDWQNEKLPYPIKVAKKKGYTYQQLPASHSDPEQGSTWNKWSISRFCERIEKNIPPFKETDITDQTQIGYEFSDGKFCIKIMEGYEDKKEIFSIPFIAEKPTAGVILVAKTLARNVDYKFQTQRYIIKNRETEEGKAIIAFSGKKAWICSAARNIEPLEVTVSGSLKIGNPRLHSVKDKTFISFRGWENDIPVRIFETEKECVKAYADDLRTQAQAFRQEAQTIIEETQIKVQQIISKAEKMEEKAKKAEEIR